MSKVIPDDLFLSDETTATASAEKDVSPQSSPPPASIFPGLSPDAQELLLALQWLTSLRGD